MKTKNTRVSLKKLVKNKSNKINKLVSNPVRKTKKTGGKHKSKRARSNKKGGFRPFGRRPNINNLGVYGVYDDNLNLVENDVRKYLNDRFGKSISNEFKKKIFPDTYINYHSYKEIPGYSKTHSLKQYIPAKRTYNQDYKSYTIDYDIYTKTTELEGPKYLLYKPSMFDSPIIYGSEHKKDFLAMDYVDYV